MPETEQRTLTPWCATFVAAGGVLLVCAGLVGAVPTAVVLLGLGSFLAYGWGRLLDLPSPDGVRAVLGIATLGTVGASLLGDGRDLRWVPVALAITLVASFMHQLLRRDGRPRLVETLGGTALGAGLLASGACFIGAAEQADGPVLILSAALAVAVSSVLDWALLRHRFAEWALPVAVAVSSAIAALLALLLSGPIFGAFGVAVVAAIVSHAVRRLLTVLPTATPTLAQVSIGTAALLSTGVVPYAAVWLVDAFV